MADAEETVYMYLYSTNRPYSLIDIFGNLGKKIGKTAVSKALDSLVSKGKVSEKIYNKQKVFLVNQDVFGSGSNDELQKLDTDIGKQDDVAKKSAEHLCALESELKAVVSEPATNEAVEEFQSLQEIIAAKRKKLALLTSGKNTISVEERDTVYSQRSKFVREWRKRKRIALELMEPVIDGSSKSKKELLEEIGVETDEDCAVSFPVVE